MTLNLLLRLITFKFDPCGKIIHQVSCLWSTLYLWVNPYWSLKIEGLDKIDRKKSYVIVANHSSMADILVIFATFLNFKWLSKKSMLKVPFLGWNMWLNNYVTVDRKDPESRQRSLELSKMWLLKGMSMLFFPEGTRSKNGTLGEFRLGAFKLAAETQSSILPLVIRGSHSALPKHSSLVKTRSKMTLKVLDPIVANHQSAEELLKMTHEKIGRNILP